MFRDEPEQVKPFLIEATRTLRSLPAYLRAQVCQTLADRMPSPNVVLSLTNRWADEVSEPNKSIASLAYHRALLRAREAGDIDDEEWDLALERLTEQGDRYGFEYVAQRRAAWVGMCVFSDWSMVKERVGKVSRPSPVSVELTSALYGLDMTLLQQVASRWDELRTEFGDMLFTHLTVDGQHESSGAIWNCLARVATQNPTIQQELEEAVADDPELLRLNGVLAWFVSRRNTNPEVIADTLVSNLQERRDWPYSLASVLISECERFGLQREELRTRLEKALLKVPVDTGDSALEALAALFPEHKAVRESWQELSELIADNRGPKGHAVQPSTYFALAYAGIDHSEVVNQIQRNLSRLSEIKDPYVDTAFVRNVSFRLRRDTAAADLVREAVMNPDMPDTTAAQVVSLLSDATGLDENLLHEVERRMAHQRDVVLAPIVRDHAVSANLSVSNIFMRVADAAWDVRSN